MSINKETFDKLVWEVVQELREKTTTLDNHHAYAIIKDRLDSLWEQARLLQPTDDQRTILGGLVAIAATSQLAAENLSLAPEQLGRDETADKAEDRVTEIQESVRQMMFELTQSSKRIPSLQRDIPRYAFEFGDDFIDKWRGLAGQD